MENYNELRLKIFPLLEEMQALRESVGGKAYRSLWPIRTAFFIYKHNYRVLQKTIDNYYSDHYNMSVDERRWRLQRVLAKDLQNVIISARTYIEQTDKENAYRQDGFHCFMKELRNFIVHRQIIPFTSNLKGENGVITRRELLERQPILAFLNECIAHDKKGKKQGLRCAKEFLLEQPDISLNRLLKEYDEKMLALHASNVVGAVSLQALVLNKFIDEVTALHRREKEIGVRSGLPITEAQLRHLCFLVKKAGVTPV